jgi:DNA-binding MarR family transcriptional regulator
MPASEPPTPDLAADLRVVLGQLIRRLRAERTGIPLGQVTVLGRLERGGPAGISGLAAAERVRPQSMAATVAALQDAGLVTRRADPGDGRRTLVELTAAGREALLADRRRREDWLAAAIERDLSARERRVLAEAATLLARLADDEAAGGRAGGPARGASR